jgi:hypothetical protein
MTGYHNGSYSTGHGLNVHIPPKGGDMTDEHAPTMHDCSPPRGWGAPGDPIAGRCWCKSFSYPEKSCPYRDATTGACRAKAADVAPRDTADPSPDTTQEADR